MYSYRAYYVAWNCTFIFLFQKSPLKEKDLTVVLCHCPGLVWVSICHFPTLSFDVFSKGRVRPLVLPVDTWIRHLIHDYSFWWIRWVQGVTCHHYPWVESSRNLQLNSWRMQYIDWQRSRSCFKAQDSTSWIERGLKIESASLGIHTAGFGRQPTLITINCQSLELGTTPWC